MKVAVGVVADLVSLGVGPREDLARPVAEPVTLEKERRSHSLAGECVKELSRVARVRTVIEYERHSL